LVLVLAPRVFSGFSRFPTFAKISTSKFQFDLETVDEVALCGNATAISYYNNNNFICQKFKLNNNYLQDKRLKERLNIYMIIAFDYFRKFYNKW